MCQAYEAEKELLRKIPMKKHQHTGKPRTYDPKCKCENCEWAAAQIKSLRKKPSPIIGKK